MTKFLSRNRAVMLAIIVMGIALLVILLPNLLIADAPPGTSRLMGSERNVWLEHMVREDRRYARQDAEHANAVQAAAADAAWWERMAQYYRAQADQAAQRVRANEAMAQRWEAMVDFYTRKAAADAQRANDAMAARWKGLAEFYAAQPK